MKSLILAAGLLAIGATAASAQYAPYSSGEHRYERRFHDACQSKSIRLHDYERRAARDGVITPGERRTIRDLQRDLDRTCGGYRHRG
jgi:hypothetical protein